jgi:membrane protein implicated in regulation of membrane protease activity
MSANVLWYLSNRKFMTVPKKIWPSRGIPFSEFWPILGLLFIVVIIIFQDDVFVRCTGNALPTGKGAGVGFLIIGLSIVCSPYLLGGSLFQIILFFAFYTILAMLLRLIYKIWLHQKYVGHLREKDKEYRRKRS